jgi:hypothetical protein
MISGYTSNDIRDHTFAGGGRSANRDDVDGANEFGECGIKRCGRRSTRRSPHNIGRCFYRQRLQPEECRREANLLLWIFP